MFSLEIWNLYINGLMLITWNSITNYVGWLKIIYDVHLQGVINCMTRLSDVTRDLTCFSSYDWSEAIVHVL